jgi:hypothetical protein
MSDATNCRLSKGSDQSKTNEMGGACGMYGGQVNCIRGLGGRHLRENDQLVYLGVGGNITLNGPSRSVMEWYVLDCSEVG